MKMPTSKTYSLINWYLSGYDIRAVNSLGPFSFWAAFIFCFRAIWAETCVLLKWNFTAAPGALEINRDSSAVTHRCGSSRLRLKVEAETDHLRMHSLNYFICLYGWCLIATQGAEFCGILNAG